jgi:hypothetical protein
LKQKCTLGKFVYSASYAQKEHDAVRSETQSGIVIDRAEAERLDAIISSCSKASRSATYAPTTAAR